MDQAASAMCRSITPPIPSSRQDVYSVVGAEPDGGGAVQGAITEADLRKGAAAGGAVQDAVVVIQDRPHESRTFRLYLRCSWVEPPEYLGVALHRGRGLRSHRQLDPWISFLDTLLYTGPVTVLRAEDPRVSELGLVGFP